MQVRVETLWATGVAVVLLIAGGVLIAFNPAMGLVLIAVVVILGYVAIFSIACANAADRRNRNVTGWAIGGVLFGPSALILLVLLRDAHRTPAGWAALVCDRCSARQNVKVEGGAASDDNCYRCGHALI